MTKAFRRFPSGGNGDSRCGRYAGRCRAKRFRHPAARTATLEKLVSTGFVQRKKKQLIPTEKGTNLIAVLPDNIKSPILTAEWESRLKQVERGELSAESFMEGIADMSRALVKEHTAPEERFASLFPDAKGKAHEAVGVCPRCGARYMRAKRDSSVITGNALLPSGKTINSFPVRKNPLQNLWRRLF